MLAKAISLENAKFDKLFYFVANVVVVRPEDRRALILKRHELEVAHPGKWCVLGGKLEWSDLDINHPSRVNGNVLDFYGIVEDLLVREAREEAGVEIDRQLQYVNSVGYIRPDGVPSVMVKFAARYISGEVVFEEDSFTDSAWVTMDELKGYDCIEGIPEEIEKALKLIN